MFTVVILTHPSLHKYKRIGDFDTYNKARRICRRALLK